MADLPPSHNSSGSSTSTAMVAAASLLCLARLGCACNPKRVRLVKDSKEMRPSATRWCHNAAPEPKQLPTPASDKSQEPESQMENATVAFAVAFTVAAILWSWVMTPGDHRREATNSGMQPSPSS